MIRHGSERNELRLFSMDKRGVAVTLDMSSMEVSSQSNLRPPLINVQDVIRRGEAGWAFSLPGQEKTPIIIPDAADGIIDGKLRLDPNDSNPTHLIETPGGPMQLGEFSKILLNQEKLASLPDGNIATEYYTNLRGEYRLDVWRLNGQEEGKFGTISAGRLVREDGRDIWQSFATIRGAGETPPSLEEKVTVPAHEIFHLSPPTATELIPPAQPEAPPIIPIPFAPRHPLERLVLGPPVPDRIGPYGYYWYGEVPDDRREFYKSRQSERLRHNPNVNLRGEEELPDYFTRQNPEHIQQLEAYLSQDGMREPMDDNCDAIVCIPVYTLGEGKVIENALEQYLIQVDKTRNKQAIDPRKFEITLFLNHPRPMREEVERQIGKPISEGSEGRVKAGRPEAYDTKEVIRQFMVKHPELRIRVMTTEFDQRPLWGQIIKPLYDVAMLRSVRRGQPKNKDPLIITNDIDAVNMSPTYLRDILQTMDLNEIASSRDPSVRKLDGLVGKIDMPNRGYEKYPGFLAAIRLYQFLDAQVRRRAERGVLTQGRSTILRASTLAAIGGANPYTDAGADTELGRVISFLRNNQNTIRYLNGAWLHTDPRREVDMWLKGVPLAYAWDEWAAMKVYGRDWKSRFNVPPQDPSRIERNFLEKEVNAELQRWGLHADSREIRRALAFLGFKPGDYHVENGQIVLGSVDGVISNLQQYIREKRWELTDRRKEEALKTPPVANVTPRYSAEYIDYEEYDRLYADIFQSREYPWTPDPTNPSPTIIDLGSHIGMSVLYFKGLAPDAKITAVEANPQTAEVLRRNVSRNHLQNVKVIQKAASSRTGNVNLYMPKPGIDFRWGDFVGGRPIDPSKYDVVSIPAVRLSSLIRGPVDLLKIDIEGSELEVLREGETKLTQVKQVMLEFHNDPANPTNSLPEVLNILSRQGYQVEVRQWNQPIDVNTLDLSQQFFLTILANRP